MAYRSYNCPWVEDFENSWTRKKGLKSTTGNCQLAAGPTSRNQSNAARYASLKDDLWFGSYFRVCDLRLPAANSTFQMFPMKYTKNACAATRVNTIVHSPLKEKNRMLADESWTRRGWVTAGTCRVPVPQLQDKYPTRKPSPSSARLGCLWVTAGRVRVMAVICAAARLGILYTMHERKIDELNM